MFDTVFVLPFQWTLLSELITQDTYEKTVLKNPVASNLIEKATDMLDDFENTAQSSNWKQKSGRFLLIHNTHNLQKSVANKVVFLQDVVYYSHNYWEYTFYESEQFWREKLKLFKVYFEAQSSSHFHFPDK